MKAFSYSEARQRLSELLNIARNEEVVIKRRGGETFSSSTGKAHSHHLPFQECRPKPPLKIFSQQFAMYGLVLQNEKNKYCRTHNSVLNENHPALLAAALGDFARVHGMSEIASAESP